MWETDNFTVSYIKNTTRFSLFGTTFSPLFYELSEKKSCLKGLNVVYLSEITAMTLTFRNHTADITYCADATLFLHMASGGLSLTAGFFLRHFIALNVIWSRFLGAKLCFQPILYPLNMLNKTRLM